MEARVIRLWALAILVGEVALAGSGVRLEAQASRPAVQASPASPSLTHSLLDKATAFEARGRMDMAVQTWQEVLLSDPKNAEALGNLARAAKLSGDITLSDSYLAQLRAISPNDPNIARVENMATQQDRTSQLKKAGDLADSGQNEAAMAIYRQIFGATPPAGDWAVAYYETEAPTANGRPHAIAGLRALVTKYPGDSRYQVALGSILVQDPQTRAEGRRMLERFPKDKKADEGVRQSLLWDAANPAIAAQIRAYLATHSDAELAAALKANASAAAGSNADASAMPAPAAARTPSPAPSAPGADGSTAEMAAYQALNANRVDDAETRFKAILTKEPENPQALAGMGYVRMQQGNFLGAISFLEQAKGKDPNDKGLSAALDTARFWFIMGEGQRAITGSDLTTAEKRYGEALELRPDSPEALNGLGGTLLKAQQPGPAIPLFERAVEAEPVSIDGWRGLLTAQTQAGEAALALATEKRIPAAIHAKLMGDPLFLQTLATAYLGVGRNADAQGVLESALKLPFAADQMGEKASVELQLAGILFASNQLEQAGRIYSQAIAEDNRNGPAWQGLVRVKHAMGQDQEALQTVKAMPPASYAEAMRDPGFEVTVASIYQAQKQFDVAQDLLQKVVTQQTNAGQRPSAGLELQLAGIYMERGNPQLAYPIYQQVIRERPDSADAWAGLLAALHVTGHDKEAVAQLEQVPPVVRTQLEKNVGYLQTMASVYGALGRSREATPFLSRAEQDYAAQRTAPPVDVEIQRAWLLYNGMDDAGLYRQLLALGGRSDLSEQQRQAVETIWMNWAVRRANQASAAGNTRLALATLNAAAESFPDNPAAVKALANGYAQAGQPEQALAIYKTQKMAPVSAADYEVAIGAALAAGDNKDAEKWMAKALAAYPTDPQILILGAKYEQSHGNTAKAIEYYHASLKAMPPLHSGSRLAGELGLPAPTAPLRLPSADQPQDLSILLAPGTGEPAASGEEDGRNDGLRASPAPLPPYDGASGVVPPYMSNPDITNPNMTDPGTAAGGNQAASLPGASAKAEVDSAVQSASAQAMGAGPAAGGGEVYGPYVPYVAPPRPASPTASPRAGSAVAVQLGDNTPAPAQPQAEVTDVLPTVRYAPSARANQAAAAQPEVDAARAARIRRLQADAAAARAGQSHPPEEAISGGTQVVRPAAPGRLGDVPDSGAQQYPQPRTPPAPEAQATMPQPVPEPIAPAPAAPQPVPPASGPREIATVAPPPPPTDAELAARSLRGYLAGQAPLPLTPRQQAESQLAALEGSYSGWLGATGAGRYRSGTPGLDRLYDAEAPVEASVAMGRMLRLTAVARAVSLTSGALSASNLPAGYVPYIGTLPANAANPPAEAFPNGVGGELQLTAKNFGVAVGYTPFEFLVRNTTGRFNLRTLGGHLLLFAERQPVKDTQLSYAGLRDPGVAAQGLLGPIWGGVVSTTGGVRIEVGSGGASFFLSGDGGVLTGRHVLDNYRYEGALGANFRVKSWSGAGSLTVGGKLFGMRYDHDEVGLTYGQGGYFSPDLYFLASVPVTVAGGYKSSFHYSVTGSLGMQTFQQDVAPFYPLDPALQQSFVPAAGATCTAAQAASYNCGEYPLSIESSLNYAIDGEAAYRFGEHWYGGAFVSGNNTNNYNTVSGGFFFRYVFRAQRPSEGYPTGLFPVQGLRPLQIP